MERLWMFRPTIRTPSSTENSKPRSGRKWRVKQKNIFLEIFHKFWIVSVDRVFTDTPFQSGKKEHILNGSHGACQPFDVCPFSCCLIGLCTGDEENAPTQSPLDPAHECFVVHSTNQVFRVCFPRTRLGCSWTRTSIPQTAIVLERLEAHHSICRCSRTRHHRFRIIYNVASSTLPLPPKNAK